MKTSELRNKKVEYRIEELIDIPLFQKLQDDLNDFYPFPSSITDINGNVLTATAWQDVCTKFHRKNAKCKRSSVRCQMSNVKCQMSKWEKSDVKCQVSDVKYQMLKCENAKCQVSYVKCQ